MLQDGRRRGFQLPCRYKMEVRVTFSGPSMHIHKKNWLPLQVLRLEKRAQLKRDLDELFFLEIILIHSTETDGLLNTDTDSKIEHQLCKMLSIDQDDGGRDAFGEPDGFP